MVVGDSSSHGWSKVPAMTLLPVKILSRCDSDDEHVLGDDASSDQEHKRIPRTRQ